MTANLPNLLISMPSRNDFARRSSPKDRGGFVLVAVLLLIALATVLIVTTSSVSQIERKAVANSAKEDQARQNALFALQVALAQLQKEAGPDQRVTATADILSGGGAVTNPYWTGVWKTYNPQWASDPVRQPWHRPQPLDIQMISQNTPILRSWSTNPANVTWLVSGATDVSTVNPLTWSTNATNSVLLASNWGTNAAANMVSAPLVLMTNTYTIGGATKTNFGGYAYWVSDEGVKAKVTLTDTNMSSLPVSTQGMLVSSLLHVTAPAAHNIASVMKGFGINGISDIRGSTNLAKLTSLNGLSFVSKNIPVVTNNILAADLTVNGYGVLCDVRKGGLKQDLTAAMESTRVNSNAFRALQLRSGAQDGSVTSNDSLMAYRASSLGLPQNLTPYISLGTQSIIDGLRWQSVYNFYNLYKKQWPQSPLVSGAPGTAPAGVGPPSLGTQNTVGPRNPFWNDPAGTANLNYGMLTPAIISQSIIVTLGAVANNIMVGTNTVQNYQFQVSYYPMVVMHNPYSVALNVGNTAFAIQKNLAQGIRATLTSLTNSSSNLWPSYTDINTNTTTSILQPFQYVSVSVTNPPGTVLYPGEIRVYSLPGINRTFTDTNLLNYCNFIPTSSRTLVSTNTLSIGNGFGGVSVTLTNWPGTTNASERFTFANPTNNVNINYNTTKFTPSGIFNNSSYPSTVPTWPVSASVASKDIDLPGSLIGTSSTNSYSKVSNNFTIGDLVNNPITILSVTERLKGILPATTYLGYIGQGSNYPLFMGNSVFYNAGRSGAGLAGINSRATETAVLITNEPAVSVIVNPVSLNSCTTSWLFQPVGDAQPDASTTTNNNVTLVLRDIPFAPLTSLGQLMHLEEYYNRGMSNNTYNLFPVCIPGMSIGGSLCSPEASPSVNAIFYNGNSPNTQWRLWADHSFLANEALFDTYFFSTVPPSGGFSWGSELSGNNPFSVSLTPTSIANGQPLPNSRFVYYRKNGTNPAVSDLQDESKAAANLLVDGAFNVNSTSVPAWKALLTSLDGQSFRFYNYVFGQPVDRYDPNPILRFLNVSRTTPNAPWDGMRSLTDEQVTALAEAIVNQVRARGPFLSMGDFLNRRLSTGKAYTTINLMGALQQAIESTQAQGNSKDVNNNIHGTFSVSTDSFAYVNAGNPAYPSPGYNSQIGINKIALDSATGIPGYLMQQDLVQAFAPVMTVRSDTFMIRVYGETRNPKSQNIEGKAYGEAVVQRLPDYFDQTDPALSQSKVLGLTTPLGDATPVYGPGGPIVNSLNQTFGRRFKIVSFRWMNQNEL